MCYCYRITFVPGNQIVLADSLSRNTFDNKSTYKDDLSEEIECCVRFIVNNLLASKNLLDEIREEQKNGIICCRLREYSLGAWPHTPRGKLPEGLLPLLSITT